MSVLAKAGDDADSTKVVLERVVDDSFITTLELGTCEAEASVEWLVAKDP